MSMNPWVTSVGSIGGGWRFFFLLGVLLVLLGVLAIAAPLVVTEAVILLLGVFVLLAGVFQTAHAFLALRWNGFLLELLLGILDIVFGLFMIAWPVEAAKVITFLLAAWFIVSGSFRIGAATAIRFPNWGWTLVGGIVSALLGVLILIGWPETGQIFLGLCIGIALLFQGWSWIMLGLSLRSLMTTTLE
ncbi:MAG: DUF308 domain-containing protein [Gemmatales bacterium]|nr:DUF308 domain-containing protein [Gemmatales bacterium]MDW8387757.1 DUF308 domain-containing protein [Gemmatales bacterium]